MRDPLYSAIEERLSKPLDHDVFEQCAASLLRSIYPTLVPVRGGHDAGMDGYVAPADDSPMILVATTGADLVGNLRKNLRSHLKGKGGARRAIFATSQSPSQEGPPRLKLETAAKKLGFQLVHSVFGSWFADQLYSAPHWRKKLLGLTGATPALSAIPLSRRPSIVLPLVGRQRVLELLRAIDGDILIVGKPGIGKTAVLRELVGEDWGLFLVDDSNERLPDAIREQRPKRIILDDAHFKPGRLTKLHQLREEIDGNFRIVAVTWPGAKDDVLGHLGLSARDVEIGPLSRPEIVEVIAQAGIKGPVDFVREIVNQAMGRPGLATTLALMSLNGKAQEVATGEELLKDTRVTYGELLGVRSAAVLAVIALSGSAGVDFRTIDTALKLDRPSTQRLVEGLASGGTIDEARTGGGRLIVQPKSLRYAVVREMFSGGVGSLPLDEVLKTFAEPSSAIIPLVGAVHRGAKVDRNILKSLIVQNKDPAAFAAYASLGEEEAKFALSAAPQHALGIAQAALPRSPDLAFRVLMTKAIGDDRPRHSYPDQPMRVIKDYLGHPSGMLEQRQQLVRVVSAWVAEGADPEVALEALCCALKPGFETTTTDPGRGDTVTIRAGVLSLQALRQIARLWDQALELIPTIRCRSYVVLLEALEDWVYPSRSMVQSIEPEGESIQFMRKQSARLIGRLAKRLQHHRGVLARLSRLSTRAQLGVKVTTDREFDVLFPEHDLSDWQAAERRQLRAAQELAESMRSLPTATAVARIVAAEREASQAGIGYPRMTVQICDYLSDQRSKSLEYVRILVKHGAAADLVLPFLVSLVTTKPRGWSQTIGRLLDHEQYWGVAVGVCLSKPVGSTLQGAAIRRCDGRVRTMLEALAIRDELDDGVVDGLLDHSDPDVARSVAIHLEEPTERFPDETLRKWEAAIVRCPADDYRYAQILAHRSGLLVRWAEAYFKRQASKKPTYERIPDSLLSTIGNLPVESRGHLLGCVPGEGVSFYTRDLVAALVGDEEELLAFLFARAELRRYRETALRGKPTALWLKRAAMALEYGSSPEQIVAACIGGIVGWSGSEAEYWDGWVQEFDRLGRVRGPVAKQLSEAGVRHYSSLRDAAAERERHEAVYGE